MIPVMLAILMMFTIIIWIIGIIIVIGVGVIIVAAIIWIIVIVIVWREPTLFESDGIAAMRLQ